MSVHDKATVDQAIADVRGLLTLGERGKGFAALRVLADALEQARGIEAANRILTTRHDAEQFARVQAEAEREQLRRELLRAIDDSSRIVAERDRLAQEPS